PMYHCAGWCFPWAVPAAGATHVCLRVIDSDEVWRSIREEGITHFCAPPTLLSMIADCYEAVGGPLPERPVWVGTGGAPPSPTLLARMAKLRMQVTHFYGRSETYGPVDSTVIAERLRVVTEDSTDVPADGATIGELVVRGNDVMLGYYRDAEATEAVTLGGWLRTGDRGVVYPDGSVEVRDQGTDVDDLAGGENIAPAEIDRVADMRMERGAVGTPRAWDFR
ncbi:MAG: AMP-binding protein, partial [Actinomycetota bacterium]|nr:AMP-binding protein [Actinomycetota bacterium]